MGLKVSFEHRGAFEDMLDVTPVVVDDEVAQDILGYEFVPKVVGKISWFPTSLSRSQLGMRIVPEEAGLGRTSNFLDPSYSAPK